MSIDLLNNPECKSLYDYMHEITNYYRGDISSPPFGYDPDQKDGGYRSWLKINNKSMNDDFMKIAHYYIYGKFNLIEEKPQKQEIQLSLF